MRIAKLNVSTRSGDNRRPTSGLVVFDDGKDYAFSQDPIDGTWHLSGFARIAGRLERRFIRSPKRVALLKAYIEG